MNIETNQQCLPISKLPSITIADDDNVKEPKVPKVPKRNRRKQISSKSKKSRNSNKFSKVKISRIPTSVQSNRLKKKSKKKKKKKKTRRRQTMEIVVEDDDEEDDEEDVEEDVEEDDEEQVTKSQLEFAKQILLDQELGYYWMSDPVSAFKVFVDDTMKVRDIVKIVMSVQNIKSNNLLKEYNEFREQKGESILKFRTITMDELFMFLDEMVCSICLKPTTQCGNSIGCIACTLWFHEHCISEVANDFKCTLCLLKKELKDNDS